MSHVFEEMIADADRETLKEFLGMLFTQGGDVWHANHNLALLSKFRNLDDPRDWLRIRATARHRKIDVRDLEYAVDYHMSRNMDEDEQLPVLQTIGAFVAQPNGEEPWIIDGLLPARGLSIMASDPKCGKSTVARNILHAVCTGGSVLNRQAYKVPAVYYCLEESANEVRKHFQQLGTDGDLLQIRCGPIPRSLALELLAKDVEETGARLVVVDPLFDVLEVDEVNAYAEVNIAMKRLLSIGRKSGAHLMAVHHITKGTAGTGASGILGSTALRGATDVNILLFKAKSGKRFIMTEQRYGQSMENTELLYDRATGVVTLGDESKGNVMEDIREQMLMLLRKGPMTTLDMAESINRRKATIVQALSELVDAGLVARSKEGKRILYVAIPPEVKHEGI